MLKKLLLFPLLMCILFCGCDDKKTIKPILNDLTFNAKVEYNDKTFICHSTLNNDEIALRVIEPVAIKDFTVSVNKTGAKAMLGDLSYDLNISNDVINTLYTIIADVNSSEKIAVNNDNAVIDSKANGYKYRFVFSPSGLPISLKVENPSIKIDFQNVTINK